MVAITPGMPQRVNVVLFDEFYSKIKFLNFKFFLRSGILSCIYQI